MSADNLQASAPGAPDKQTAKILVVEDNQMNQRLAGFMLKNLGFSFSVSSSAADALQKLKLEKFDLVLMDIEMPGMNGYDCTQTIRNELKMTLPIIAMTAHDGEEEKAKCEAAGMDGYIAKPIDQDLFNAILKQHLSS